MNFYPQSCVRRVYGDFLLLSTAVSKGRRGEEITGVLKQQKDLEHM